MKTVLIGDIGGHLHELESALRKNGCDTENGVIPADVTVSQLGDLVHRGPDSLGVLRLVERFRQNSPDQWVQLIGNHEALYLGLAAFAWNERIGEEGQSLLRQWWDEGWMRVAAAVPSAGVMRRRRGGERERIMDGELLLTHAGLSAGVWQLLGRPVSASECSEALEEVARSSPNSFAWNPGAMLTGVPDERAGIVWASAAAEVIPSWIRQAEQHGSVPTLNILHGHSQSYSWNRHQWRSPLNTLIGTPKRLRDPRATVRIESFVDSYARHTRVEIHPRHTGALTVTGIDPGHGTDAVSWQPLVLPQR